MKLSVFPRGSNPAIDRHIQRKSVSYCERQVEEALADWVDSDDHLKGIICREFLAFGEKLTPAQPEPLLRKFSRNKLPPLEVSAVRFNDPNQNAETRADRHCLVVRAEAFARLSEYTLAEA